VVDGSAGEIGGWIVYGVALTGGLILTLRLARRSEVLAPVAIGASVRLAIIIVLHLVSRDHGSSGFFFLDDQDYFGAGARIAEAWSEGTIVNPADEAYAASDQVGYWVLVAATLLPVGRDLLAAKLVNGLLSTATILVAALIARDILGTRAGRWTAWTVALMPTCIWWAAPLMKEAPLALLVSAGVLCVLRLPRGRGYAVGLFAALAALALTRATAALAVASAALLTYLAAAVREREDLDWRYLAPRAGVAAAGLLAALAVLQSTGPFQAYAHTFSSLRETYQGSSSLPIDPVVIGRTMAGPFPWAFGADTDNWLRLLYPGLWVLYPLYALALAGIWRLRHHAEVLLLLVPVIVLVLLAALSAGQAFRARSGVEPLVAVLAVTGVRSWRQTGTLACAAVAVAGLLALANTREAAWLALVALASLGAVASRRLPEQSLPEPLPASPIAEATRRLSRLRHRRLLSEVRPGAEWIEPGLIGLVGLGAGAGSVLAGFYDLSVWGPISVIAITAAGVLLLSRGGIRRGPTLLAWLAIAGVAAWSLASVVWAESADSALTDANRWILYAALFTAMVSLIKSPRNAYLAIGSIAAGAAVVVLYVTADLLSSGGDLFFNNRLNDPLGYINGEAAYLLLPLWPLLAVAERSRSRLLGGGALAIAVVCCGEALLTQSRGMALALLASAALVLALVPGRPRRLCLIAMVAGALAVLAAGPLGDFTGSSETPGDDEIRSYTLLVLALAAGAGLAWGAVSWAWDRLGERLGAERASPAGRVALAAVLVVGVLASLPAASSLPGSVRDQYDDFTSLRDVQSDNRFASGGGNRYDYWRVAWDQFRDHPIRGVGAGNFATTYYRERRTSEAIRQAHSIEMQALGETGLIGALVLATFLATGCWAIRARAREGSADSDPALAVAAGGIFAFWLAQTSVDWLHLIPGLTAAALISAAALLQPWSRAPERRPRGVWAYAALAGVVVIAAGSMALVSRQFLAQHQWSVGISALVDDPRTTLTRANEALDLNDQYVNAYRLEAAAYARLGSYARSRDALLAAIDLEPSDSVNWVLLGDLQSRRGLRLTARRSYGRALELNPREPGLRALVRRS